VNQHLRKLAAVAVGVALVAAACGDDNDDSGSGATTTAASGATTTAASGATTTAAGGATTTAGAGTTAAAGTAIQFKPLDVAGPLTIAALENGDIQMGLLLSSDGTISQNGWVSLEDDKQLQPVENLVTVGNPEKLTTEYAEAIDGALSKLTTEELQALNLKMNVDKEAPADVAAGWLEENDLLSEEPALTGSIVIGSSNFNEQELVAEMVAQVLEARGVTVERKFKLGAREVVAPALENGDIDAYVEYVGSYLTFLKGEPTSDLDETMTALRAALEPKGLTALEPAPAEDKNAFVVTKATADEFSLVKISDLASITGDFVFGGPPECPERPLCIGGLESVYGLTFNV
jgi:osmoprotectant transport system substrate-binding protein